MGSRGSDSKRRKLRRHLEHTEGDVCWLCGYPLHPEAQAYTDFATEVDEELPASLGGDVYGVLTPCHLVHRCCNLKKRGKVMEQYELAEWFEEEHLDRQSYLAPDTPDWWL